MHNVVNEANLVYTFS